MGQYYNQHKQELSIKAKARYLKNKEKIKTNRKLYYQEHKEEIAKKNKEKYDKNKDKWNEEYRQWAKDNPEEVKMLNRKRYIKRREQKLQYHRQRRKNNYEKVLKMEQNYRDKNRRRIYDYLDSYRKSKHPAWSAYIHLKSRSKRIGYPVIMTREEFYHWYDATEEKCHYCDLTDLKFDKKRPYQAKYGVKRFTIDRKDNSLFYTLDNIVKACNRCNSAKNDIFSYEQFLEIGQKYVKPIWQNLINKFIENMPKEKVLCH